MLQTMVLGSLLALWALATALNLTGTITALLGLRRGRLRPRGTGVLGTEAAAPPPLSVLKPLKGLDEGLEENLRSYFTQDYPAFEIVFCVQDPADPAAPVAQALMEEFPSVSARIVVNASGESLNPKVGNLIVAAEAARHDLLLVSDSNTRVDPGFLRRLVPHFDGTVGVITAAVAGRGAASLGAHMEALYLNTFYTRWMFLTAAMGVPCVVGKCMLFSRSAAARFGGLANLSRYIAEDYMTGVAVKHLGLRTVLLPEPIPQHLGRHSLRAHWDRHIRWGRIRKAQAPLAYLAEPLGSAFGSGLLAMAAFSGLWGVEPLLALTAHGALWALSDLILHMAVGGDPSPSLPFAWAARELSAPALWLHGLLGSEVKWRGSRFTLGAGGLVSPVARLPRRGSYETFKQSGN